MIRRRRGFTMVEILIVIGVIVLLVGIGVIAYRGLDKMAASRATHVALDNATSFVVEYEHGGQLSTVHYSWFDPNALATDRAPLDFTYNPAQPGAFDASTNGAYRFTAIRNAGAILDDLSRFPKVKTVLSALPTKATIAQPATAPNEPRPASPALADGWQNPILFVPAGGMKVTLDPDGAKRNVVITSPDHRPFWVSAGPDGDFSRGDDNEYSFAK